MNVNWPRVTSAAALAAAGGPAAVISYQHMQDLSSRLGADPLVAALMPFTSDGVIVAASTVVYTAGKQRVRVPWQAWPLLLAGVAVTLVVNAAAGSGHGAGGRLLAAWPGVAFVLAFECVVQLARMAAVSAARTTPVPAPEPVSEPAPVSQPVGQPQAARTTPDTDRPVSHPVSHTGPARKTAHRATPRGSARAAQRATDTYRASVANGEPLSDRALSREHGISRRKAAEIRAAVAQEGNGHSEVHELSPN
jgi:Protein of unknown function (DUF2637)